MARENQGRSNTPPDSSALWNGGEGIAFPLLHSEASHPGIRDSNPLSFQLQDNSMGSMMSNVTQSNGLMRPVLDPLSHGGVFPARNYDITSFSALNGRQSYDLNYNLQLHGIPPSVGSNLQQYINENPINNGGELGTLRHEPENWVMPGAPQFDSSTLDGSFLSLGHRGIVVGSRWDPYASAVDNNVSTSSFPAFRQETSHGPFIPVNDGAYGSYSQNLVPSGSIGCLTLSHNDNPTVPGLASRFDVSPSLLSLGQFTEVNHQLMPAASGRSPVTGNDMNSRYIDPGSKAYQPIPSGLISNNQSRSSEFGCSSMSRLPSEAVTTRISQQSIARENQGINLTSNVFPLQPPTHFPTLGSSTWKDQPDQASQERTMHAPTWESLNVLSIAADQAVSSSSRLVHDSNVVCKNPRKRGGSSSAASVTPRKLMRQHTVGPSGFAQPQNSVLKIPGVNPSTPPTFTNISQQPIHPSSSPLIQTAPLENALGNPVPAFTPFVNTTPSPRQISISRSTNAYPNPSPSPAFTNVIQPPHHPSLVHQPQSTHLQKASSSMSQPLYRPTVTFPMQNPPGRHKLNSAAPSYYPIAVHQPSVTPPHGAPPTGNTLPVFGATGNSSPSSSNHTAEGSLPIPAKKMLATRPAARKKSLPSSSTKPASTTPRDRLRYSSVMQRLIESQSHALAAYEKKPPADAFSAGPASSMPYIKRKGPDKQEASGLKCQLCKRDLAYAPEGTVSVPAILPEVAVLPCKHVFHDHCLEAITPEDQQANPPCIPCSMGEPVG